MADNSGVDLPKMSCDQTKRSCGKCNVDLNSEDKAVTCFTCKQDFHIQCEHVSDAKHAVLSEQNEGSGIVWFCRACMRTTATMLSHVANLEIRLSAIEAEREKDKNEKTVLKKLVGALNKKLNSLEESVQKCVEDNQSELETIRGVVTTMLNEVPQTTSIEERFSSIEDSLDKLSLIPSNNSKVCLNSSYSNVEFPEISTLEVSNELSDRQRRCKNVVLHNVYDSNDPATDAEEVAAIFEDMLGEVPKFQLDLKTKRARIYRLGRYTPGRNRTIKCYLNSQEVCEQLLMQSRFLSNSTKYSNVIVQADLTPMQRSYIKQLVLEKRRRNGCARENNEEADWVIRNGRLCRKSDPNSI